MLFKGKMINVSVLASKRYIRIKQWLSTRGRKVETGQRRTGTGGKCFIEILTFFEFWTMCMYSTPPPSPHLPALKWHWEGWKLENWVSIWAFKDPSTNQNRNLRQWLHRQRPPGCTASWVDGSLAEAGLGVRRSGWPGSAVVHVSSLGSWNWVGFRSMAAAISSSKGRLSWGCT